MRMCIDCGETKPLEEFQRNAPSAGGRLRFCRDCASIRAAASRARFSEDRRAYDRRRGFRHPGSLKLAARNAIAHGLRAGTIERRPCEVCCSEAEAHHPDYTRPLDVVWLCKTHHARAHRRVIA
jgi:hypothetical protein